CPLCPQRERVTFQHQSTCVSSGRWAGSASPPGVGRQCVSSGRWAAVRLLRALGGICLVCGHVYLSYGPLGLGLGLGLGG
ncbi:unnamed protein product, partial [Bubo scandiacus]